jgi:hypothetical protein
MARLSHFQFCKQHHGSAEMTDGRCCGPEGPIPQSMRHPADRSSCYPISTRFSTGKPYLGLACCIRVACRRHRGASRRPHPDVRSSYRPSIWVRLAALAGGGGSKPTTMSNSSIRDRSGSTQVQRSSRGAAESSRSRRFSSARPQSRETVVLGWRSLLPGVSACWSSRDDDGAAAVEAVRRRLQEERSHIRA